MIQTECIYSNIVEVGKKENIQRIVDALQEMQMVMKEIAGQIQSGGFSLNDSSYQELKNDYLSQGDKHHPSFVVYIQAVNQVYYAMKTGN